MRPRSSRRKPASDARGLTLDTDKLYFKIGEVAEIVGVAPHILRYWESEFEYLRPDKSRTLQRVYRRSDVALLLRIKYLLHTEKFTIAGAKQQLSERGGDIAMAPVESAFRARQTLLKVRVQVNALAELVRRSSELDPTAADPAQYIAARGGAEAIRTRWLASAGGGAHAGAVAGGGAGTDESAEHDS